ncbi:hypothetical protein [Leucobacter sp. gxy201]|uniref:hypothetical protein n=1 Tax=Leucobacter sp. gxy201 TaxID=2957200 RepID=UPI003DA07E02
MTGERWEDGGIAWTAGPWRLELRDDEVADLAYDGRSVLRSIRAVVRDGDWSTAGWTLGEPIDEPAAPDGSGGSARRLRLPLRSTGFGSDLVGGLTIETDGDALTVAFEAVSQIDYETNRTGLVVLHPAGAAGADLRVRHADGSVERTAFPREISPHQPVRDIAALTWEHDGLEITTAFAGDVFEMEDQRNWTDASYKTYSRPLALPFPYRLVEGERVRQTVRVDVRPHSAAGVATRAEVAAIALEAGGVFPTIGVAASEAPDPAPELTAPPGGELLVELDLRTRAWPAALQRAAARGVPLDARVVSPDDVDGFDELASRLRGCRLARIAVFSASLHVSDAPLVARLRDALARTGVSAPVIGGSRSHFTELNRERHRLPDGLDGIVTATTPLFHALGTAQLIESVAMQRLIAQQTVDYAAGLPVRVGPIALRPRFNNVATRPQPTPGRHDLAEGTGTEFTGAVDARQAAPELAAWTIASAAALSVPGVAGLAYFEEWGPRGIRTSDGAPTPAAEAIAALAALAGGELLAGPSPDGLLWAVGARTTSADVRIVTANLDDRERTLRVTVPGIAIPVELRLPAFAWRLVDPT